MHQNIKYLIGVFLLIGMIGIVSSANPSYGVFQKDQCFEIKQVCQINGSICDACNITSIDYPNGTRGERDLTMTQRAGDFNVTYCNSSALGRYNVNGYCTYGTDVSKPFVVYFDVTGTGFSFTQARSSYYIALLGILIFLFLINLFIIPRIPNKDSSDEYGNIVSINQLKYLRPLFYVIAWVLLLAIFFTSSAVASAYMGDSLSENLFYTIYRVMFLLTLPMVIIWGIFLLVNIFRDMKVKKMIERGIDVPSSI